MGTHMTPMMALFAPPRTFSLSFPPKTAIDSYILGMWVCELSLCLPNGSKDREKSGGEIQYSSAQEYIYRTSRVNYRNWICFMPLVSRLTIGELRIPGKMERERQCPSTVIFFRALLFDFAFKSSQWREWNVLCESKIEPFSSVKECRWIECLFTIKCIPEKRGEREAKKVLHRGG